MPMDQKEEIAQQTIVEDEPKLSLAEKLKEKKKLKRKKIIKRSFQAIGALLFAYIMWWGFKAPKASAEYGICHTMLELHLPYPYTLYVSEMRIKRDGALELWYTHTDAFGEYRMEPLVCKIEYFADPNSGVNIPQLTELKFNKINVNPERLAYLNNAIPYFVANPLIKRYPSRLPDSLADLQLNVDAFRNVRIDPTRQQFYRR